MKNIFRIITVTLTIVVMSTSCDDLLEPTPFGQQDISVTFTDFGGTVTAVNGIYNAFVAGNLYRGENALLNVDYASDDVVGDSRIASAGYNRLDYFELPEDNAQTFTIWADLYRAIYRSNVVIERVPGLELPETLTRNSAGLLFKDQFIGEAKFLRAFSYFNLVRLFGDVPLHLVPITSPDQVNLPRTDAGQIYEQIISDLTDASLLLPPSYNNSGVGNETGRVTKWAALTMLADVYLTQKNYPLAAQTAQRVITESGRQLNATYAGNFAGRGGQENSSESLFEIQFSNNGANTGTSPFGNNYSFVMGSPSEANGGVVSLGAYRPTDNESIDNEADFSGGLIQEYEADDVRLTTTFTSTLGGGGITRWLTWKHHVLNTGSVGQANFPIYRLAEVFLIYAEATNEGNLLDETGLEYVNQLRRRAFSLPLTTTSDKDIASGLSQAEYRDIIRSERRKELAMENKRWFDLQRYGFEYANQVLKINQGRERFDANKLLLPIARIEIINNPELVQNPGWN